MPWSAVLLGVFLTTASLGQVTIRALAGSVVVDRASPTMATAMVVVENGTMYDVYLVGAAAEVAGAVEIRETPRGASAATVVKEVAVPAFGQLEMSHDGVHLVFKKLKRPLKSGESVPLSLFADNGLTLTVQVVVK
ncbi:MAG: copper chaperone PCu(A)C [Acidobacteria bacterium]|nr:copper chaperone PCu(A)C [Acidobacteriota bacterium]